MISRRRGGTIQVLVGSKTTGSGMLEAKGSWTFGLGLPKRTAYVGPDGVIQGFSEAPQPGFIEGEITDSRDLSLVQIAGLIGATIVLTLANGKGIVLNGAAYVGEATGTTEEGAFGVRFEGRATELK